MNEQMYAELTELLRIQSVSSTPGFEQQMQDAADWLVGKIEDSGGEAQIAEIPGNPLVVGDLEGPAGAPTVILYGHYDVQSADPVEDWASDPFEPEIRDGRVYARGASDDKGNFYPLMWVACDLAKRNELPVNVRFVIEGEEEVGGPNIVRYIEQDERGADAAVVFDSLMLNENTPTITLAVRGLVAAEVTVKVAERDYHSGLYGGSVPNALHILHAMLANVLPGLDGEVRPELATGAADPTPEELEDWASLPPGDIILSEVDATPISETAGAEFYRRNWSRPSFDVTGIEGGTGTQRRTVVAARAACNLGLRLAPGQRADEMESVLSELLLKDVPGYAEVTLDFYGNADPALFDARSAPVQAGQRALDRATGMQTRLTRIGGSIAILPALAARGIQTICTGFALADDKIHAPNESFRIEALDMCEKAGRELLLELAQLPA